MEDQMKYFFEVYGTLPWTIISPSWTKDHYDPMQARINELRPKHQGNETATAVLDMAQKEIDGFKKCSDQLGYEFFVAAYSL